MKKQLPKQLFVTGTGTDVGKTVASAILVEALQADYWKPVQCGGLENSDTKIVQSLISNSKTKIHPEAYRFKTPASPHYAAQQENTEVELSKLIVPVTSNTLIIEGAGGLMVPLNKKALVIDLIQHLNIPVLLVARNYLGSINHTLLSLEILRNRKIELAAILFNGKNFFDNEAIIQHFAQNPSTIHLEETESLNKSFVTQQAEKLRGQLSKLFVL